MLEFDGRVVIVTGAGGGIGRAHALMLAARGARIVVNDLGTEITGEGRSSTPAEAVVAEIAAAGGEAVANASDVGTEEGADEIRRAALEAFGRIDVVINNAGLPPQFGHFTDEGGDALDLQYHVHMRGTYLVTRAAWPHLAESDSPRIVNISSNRGLFAGLDGTPYSAAKAGIVGLTRSFAADGEAHGIKANAILPLAWTRMAASGEDTPSGQRLKSLPSDPEQVSKLVTWLAHPRFEHSGQLLTVGLGRVARVFIGVTPGIFDPDATPETLCDQEAAIMAEDGYFVPANNTEEMAVFFDNFKLA